MCDNQNQFNELLEKSTPDLAEIRRIMKEVEMDGPTVIKYLRLIENVCLMSGWGKVITLIQNKEIVRVEQEQGFKIK